ncbi:hypothetical protein AB0I98_34600 [Streptomyces sp. NPDC050211]|uniref:hypothetical protein n=1 Tax=Streptomyces sp. NPDC050211 TaxID=3154932 RepID=UPI00342D3534
MSPSESTGTIPPWFVSYVISKPFQDAVRKAVDPKWLADNVPVTGAKAEVTGVKAEANAAAFSFFGAQTEYSLFKAEGALFDLNKVLADRAQETRDKDQDDRLRGLSAGAVETGDLIAKVRQDLQSTAAALRKTLGEGDKQLRKEVPELRTKVNGIRDRLLAADQTLHGRITTLGNKIAQGTRNADDRSRAEKARVKELDKEVRAGLRRVDQLQGSAKAAGRDIGILIDRVTALERALR